MNGNSLCPFSLPTVPTPCWAMKSWGRHMNWGIVTTFIYQVVTVMVCTLLTKLMSKMIAPNRKMKGEELQGLNIEELQKLEQLLKVGLSRVSYAKVCLSLLSLFVNIIMEQWSFYMFLNERFLEEIHAITIILSRWWLPWIHSCTHLLNFRAKYLINEYVGFESRNRNLRLV